jgi:hypothetical protein
MAKIHAMPEQKNLHRYFYTNSMNHLVRFFGISGKPHPIKALGIGS